MLRWLSFVCATLFFVNPSFAAAACGSEIPVVFEVQQKRLSDLAHAVFTHDGNSLIVPNQTDDDLDNNFMNSINIYDVQKGNLVKSIQLNGEMVSLALSPDDSVLAAGFANGEIKLVDLKAGNITQTLKVAGYVKRLQFTADGNYLVAANRGETSNSNHIVFVFELANRKLRTQISLPGAEPEFALSSDGRFLAARPYTAKSDSTSLYNFTLNTTTSVFQEPANTVISKLSFLIDNSTLLGLYGGGDLRTSAFLESFYIISGTKKQFGFSSSTDALAMAVSPTDRLAVVFLSNDKDMQVSDPKRIQSIQTLNAQTLTPVALKQFNVGHFAFPQGSISPNGKYLSVSGWIGGNSHDLNFLQVNDLQLATTVSDAKVFQSPNPYGWYEIGFNHLGNRFAVKSDTNGTDDFVRVYDTSCLK